MAPFKLLNKEAENKFSLNVYRLFELKYFCLQYSYWANNVLESEHFKHKMQIVEQVALRTDELVGPYIFYYATKEKIPDNLPCCLERFKYLACKFYWLLDRYKQ